MARQRIHENQAAKARAFRAKRKLAGLCIECGKKPAKSRCEDCKENVRRRRGTLTRYLKGDVKSHRRTSEIKSSRIPKKKDTFPLEWQTVGNDKP